MNPASPSDAFRVGGLTTWFDSRNGMRKILDGVELTVRRGSTFALLGESGSGKTSLVTSVLGIHPGVPGIVSGEASVLGVDVMPELHKYVEVADGGARIRKDVAGFSREMRRRWGSMLGSKVTLVPQDATTSLSPFRNVGKLLSMAVARGAPGIGGEEARAEGRRWLDRVRMYDVESVMKRHVFELSGGMAQRVAIALALAPAPELLIADEPTTGLDATLRIELIALMAKMVKDGGVTLLLVTHDNSAARFLADEVAVLHSGMVVETGPVATVLGLGREPKHPYTSFLLEAERRLLAGAEIPRLKRELATPDGCPYRAFCDCQLARCAVERPALSGTEASGHRIACWARSE